MSINNKEYISMNYFISQTFFLGIGFSYIGTYTGKDGWISVILGFLLGNVVIWGYDKISKNINHNLGAYLDTHKIIGKIIKFFLFIFYIFSILLISVTFVNFIRVYYFFQTPIWIIPLSLFILCYYASTKKEIVIARTATIILPFALILYLFNFFCLNNYIVPNNLLPILTAKTSSIFFGAMIFTILSTLPTFLLIDEKVNLKTRLKGYLFPFISLLIISLLINTVLDNYFIITYSYPEYMILRRIRIFDFIEHVENIVSLLWYFHIFIFISLNITKINNLINKPSKKFIVPAILLLIVFIINVLFARHYNFVMFLFRNGLYVLFAFLIFTCPVLYFITKKKKSRKNS